MAVKPIDVQTMDRLMTEACSRISEELGVECTFDDKTREVRYNAPDGSPEMFKIGIQREVTYCIYNPDGTPSLRFSTPQELVDSAEGIIQGDLATL